MPRKRTHEEMAASEPAEAKELSLLQKIRNMWEFANVYQFICIFGKAVKIDEDFDVEDFENECLRPGYSERLEEIGLQLLKWVSSHRGLNYDIWDEYTRRQYQAKAPDRNPYGEEEEPKKFRHFDIFTKVRVLHQLSVWTLWNPDRMRQAMPEHQRESDQLEWRIEPIGWDEDEREYYVLDDNRLYRRSEPPLPKPEAPKAKVKYTSKKAQAARRRERTSKRRRIEDDDDEDADLPNGNEDGDGEDTKIEETNADVTTNLENMPETDPSKADTYGGYTWECIAVTLEEYNQFLDSIKKGRDANQKVLRETLISSIIPEIERQAEVQERKQERRAKELAVLERLATAKRSSRLADKHDRERRDAEAAEAERHRANMLAEARREEEKQKKLEQERHSRMMTREQRIKEREYKRVLMEEQLTKDAEEQKRIDEGEARGSSRQIKERIEKSKKELEELQEEDWTFDCSGCGRYGKNFDDGQHSVACEKCNVWQHSKCLGIAKTEAERDDFHFICKDCRRKEEEAKRPKISLKFKVGPSSSPPQAISSPKHSKSPVEQRSSNVHPAAHHQLTQQPGSGSAVNGQFYPAQSPPRPQQFPPPSMGSQVLQPWPPNYAQHPSPASGSVPVDSSIAVNGISASSQPPSGYHVQSYYQQPPQQPPYSQHASFPYRSPPAQYYPHQNGMAQPNYQQANPPQQPHTSNSQRPVSGQSPSNRVRLPSPIANRPTMSPTQGNHDVGPIAGVPGSSPPQRTVGLHSSQHPSPGNHYSTSIQANGMQQPSPRQTSSQNLNISSSPPMQPMSGLSPVKQRTHSPLPPPSNIPLKQSASKSPPTPAVNGPVGRSISGTPIFPPAEKLAPSPEQIHQLPVPTPSKQPTFNAMETAEPKQISSSFGSTGEMIQSSPAPTPTPVQQPQLAKSQESKSNPEPSRALEQGQARQ